MAGDSSFDIVSKIDHQEVDNAVNGFSREGFFNRTRIGDISSFEQEFLLKKSGRRRKVEKHNLLAAGEELLGDVQADEACAAGDQDHFLKPRIPEAAERGSRRCGRPSSTLRRNSMTARLNASGSSMLMVCPE